MRRYLSGVLATISVAILTAIAVPAQAGTQDFVLVNETGFDIHEVYISETKNDDWEEDVLGRDILEEGDRLDMKFRGRSACLWDLMAIDEDEESIEWSAINLCEVSVVVLSCDKNECWAETE